MRLLVACSHCKRQFDASALQPHDHFRCHCGTTLEVPEPKAHDATVVRCSSCGAPRNEERSNCVFCDSDFTLHERDLHTMCSGCFARISDQAKFCHHCATPVLAADLAGDPTTYHCPSCSGSKNLHSRRFGDLAIAVMECPSCGGLWLSRSSFDFLIDRARQAQAQVDIGTPDLTMARQKSGRDSADTFYRACPICKKLMNRKNYGSKSGVIIDTCREHGYWFDASELDLILRWIRAGREKQAKRLIEEREQQAKRDARLRKAIEPLGVPWEEPESQPIPIFEILDFLVALFRK